MVYKIRNTSFFWTNSGFKNNFAAKVMNMPRQIDPTTTFLLRTRYDHHSFLRAFQLYRNISRHCKQYFYGDKKLEERFILTFREMFRIPLTSETPTHLLKYGGPRRFVDQGDREFELVSYNQHPYQLLAYQFNNEELQQEVENQELRNAGETPLADQMVDYFNERIDGERHALTEGETISYDRWVEILGDSVRKYKSEVARPGSTKDENGNFQDFLEVRRPFVSPTHDGATH